MLCLQPGSITFSFLVGFSGWETPGEGERVKEGTEVRVFFLCVLLGGPRFGSSFLLPCHSLASCNSYLFLVLSSIKRIIASCFLTACPWVFHHSWSTPAALPTLYNQLLHSRFFNCPLECAVSFLLGPWLIQPSKGFVESMWTIFFLQNACFMVIVKYFSLFWNKEGQPGMVGKAEKKEREGKRGRPVTILAIGIFTLFHWMSCLNFLQVSPALSQKPAFQNAISNMLNTSLWDFRSLYFK